MTPDKKRGIKRASRFLNLGIAAFLATFGANEVQAQSAYGCSGLESDAALPAIEGKQGVFFTLRPELQSHHGLADETIAHLSNLSEALGARGTVLVLLPVPTRAQVLSQELPPMADYVGFDLAASIAVHEDMILRLKKAGLTVADPLTGLRTAALAGERPFFETDPRPTTIGTRVMAAAVGAALADHPGLVDVTRGTFSSTAQGTADLPSAMRRKLQSSCQSELPLVTTQTFTTRSGAPGGAEPDVGLVVLGTSITSTAELNLPGFLSEATGLKTLGYGVDKGGAFAAISSYLTSADFQTTPPRVLVWELPVAASLAANGDQPIRELIAAAVNSCQRELEVRNTSNSNRLAADLDQLFDAERAVLTLDTGGIEMPFVRFHFTGTDGQLRTRSIYRHPGQLLTGRFYLPLSGLSADDLRGLEVEAPAPFGARSRLLLCS